MSTKLSIFDKLHFLERAYRYRYRTERYQLRHLLSLDLQGATVVDVGSNRGIYAYWLRRAVGQEGKVYAFEPQPELVTDLYRLRDWLVCDNVRIRSEALSDKAMIGGLRRQKVGDGGATLELSGEASGHSDTKVLDSTVTVTTTTLDSVAAGWPDQEPFRFIKIDVEGHEKSVLGGAIDTLKRFRPTIQVELRVDHPDAEDSIELLTSLGYKGWMFLDGGRISLERYKTVPSKKFGLTGHRDFLFSSAP